MDNRGLELRKDKSFTVAEMYEIAVKSKKLRAHIDAWFDITDDKIKLNNRVKKKDIELIIFNTMGYDEKLVKCIRPEQLKNLDEQAWNEINHHLGTARERGSAGKKKLSWRASNDSLVC